MARRVAPLGLAAAVLLLPERAFAYSAAVDATFDAQLYQVTSPYGDPIVRRRRYTETLALRVDDIQGPRDPGRPSLHAVARLRMDADIGQDPNERSPGREDRFVPGLSESPLDVMTAYIEGRNYFHGHVNFRLGRQYVIDPLGFWSFDGALVRLSTPAHLAAEAYGGFEQRGGVSLVSTSRFEADGVYRGDRRGMGPELYPAYLDESRLAPAWGVAVESTDLGWLSTRLAYRRVVNRDAVVVAPFTDATGALPTYSDDRISSEKIGWSGSAVASDVGALRGSFVYDVYRDVPTEYFASAEAFLGPAWNVGTDVDYFLPTFDGDSIFNWFSVGGTTKVTARARAKLGHRLSVAGSIGGRRFGTGSGTSAAWDALGTADATYSHPAGRASLRLTNERGERARVHGADLSVLQTFDRNLYDASTILSLYDFRDELRPDRAATSFTYVLGGGYRPFPRTRVGIEWEHSMSELVGHRFRALATLAVTVY